MSYLTRDYKFANSDIGRKIARKDEDGVRQTGVVDDWVSGLVIIKWDDRTELEEVPDFRFCELYFLK